MSENCPLLGRPGDWLKRKGKTADKDVEKNVDTFTGLCSHLGGEAETGQSSITSLRSQQRSGSTLSDDISEGSRDGGAVCQQKRTAPGAGCWDTKAMH